MGKNPEMIQLERNLTTSSSSYGIAGSGYRNVNDIFVPSSAGCKESIPTMPVVYCTTPTYLTMI